MSAGSLRLPRLTWKVSIGLALMPLAGLYAYSYARTFDPAYESLPATTWRSVDARRIAAAPSATAAPADLFSPARALAADPSVPSALVYAGDAWVRAINVNNPDAILHHEPDSLGNLYLVLGAWWMDLDGTGQVKALDGLGNAWRAFLADSFGDWGQGSGFAPGLVLIDTQGTYAHNLNNEIRILRRPVF
jgi:hypothetical protein